jgi:amino acid adenylation domain-containing protein/non-ribosomal peptide synthase protein (TIGR01720 family)
LDELGLRISAVKRSGSGQAVSLSSQNYVYDLFEEQAERHPHAIALIDEHGLLTYREVNERANQLARYLRQLGFGPEQLAAVYLERSSALIVSLLAILKAGGAYLPLDPSTPPERMAFMLEDSRATVLVTRYTSDPESQAPKSSDAPFSALRARFFGQVVDLVADARAIAGQPTENINVDVMPSNLAYVIYTSGSTGRPKGVQIEHSSLMHLIAWHRQAFNVSPADRATQVASPAFDAMVWEIWPYLTGGASIAIPDATTKADVALLRDWMRAQAVTISFLPTPIAALMIRLAWPERPALRILLTGGDRLQSAPPTGLPFALVNNYGPTESTVVATSGQVMPEATAERGPSIGWPLPSVDIVLLDSDLQPVPNGMPGELCISGPQLARGYLGRADLTAERFVPNPFPNEVAPGEEAERQLGCSSAHSRLYRTGDLARYLPDGSLEFLGRIDHQVKIRGYRIELGEIEAVVCQHPGVQSAIVLAREDVPGERRLVAYVTPAQTAGGSQSEPAPPLSSFSQELRMFLSERLPAYMLPAAYVLLETLPLTSNGKIDRSALPAPSPERPKLAAGFVTPETPAEALLARIWAETLGVRQVGRHDNFFELGGDSILSFQIIARAHQAGLHISTKLLFQHPTVAGLAAASGVQPAQIAEQGPVTGPLPLTPIQRWFFEQNFPDPHHWNQAMLLELPAEVDLFRLERALGQIVVHHDALRLQFARSATGWEQFNAGPERGVSLLRVDLSGLPAAEQPLALEQTAAQVQASLDLAHPPRLAAALFDLGHGQPRRLLIAINYPAIDGVSWRILLEDLQSAYRQAGSGSAVQLPLKTTSYQRWAERLAGHARSEELRRELGYWLEVIAGADPHLPLDFPDGENSVASARRITVSLTADETRALLQDVPKAYQTQINDILLAALMQVFARLYGASALLIHLESHGREDLFDDVNVSRTVGWFTSLFPVSLRLDADSSPRAALLAIQEQLRRIPNRGVGYGVLRYMSGDAEIAEQLQTLPRPRLRFNYLGQFDQVLSGASMFRRAAEGYGPTRSLRGHRTHALVAEGLIAEGCLHFEWTYSANLHRDTTVVALAQGYIAALRELIDHCQEAKARAYTPASFPLARLDERKLDLVARLLAATEPPQTQRLRAIEDLYPLSLMQQGLLFHVRRAPESALYFVQWRATLRGALDVPAFRRAWQAVVERHPALRSSFLWDQLEEPLQIVWQRVETPWAQEDWRAVSAAEQDERLRQMLQADQRRGFDLAQAPLMRLSLIQLDTSAHECVWSFSHVLLDGWSAALIVREVFAHYRALQQGQTVALPPAPPYRDHIAWLQRQDTAQAKIFWGNKLTGFTAPTPLVVDRAPAVTPEPERYAEVACGLSAEAVAALHGFAREHQLTLNTIVQGAWAILLHRYSAHEDVLFGATVAGRSAELSGVDRMAGLFVNTLPVRVHVAPQARLRTWLLDLQQQELEARQYEHTPLVQIQSWSEIGAGQPLFHSLLSFENYPGGDLARETKPVGLEIDGIRVHERTNYPLTVSITLGAGVALKFIYDERSFDPGAIERLAGHLRTLLEHIPRDPARRLEELPLLTTQEQQLLLKEWTATATAYPRDAAIHTLFAAEAARRPQAIALIQDDVQITYGELNRRANQLAHHLRSRGVGPETLVGVCLERSTALVVATLGVLKAGGAYVPLDPAYPQERLTLMLHDIQAPVVLTQESLVGHLPSSHAAVICLDRDWAEIARAPLDNPTAPASADTLAYVIYTSGSTGRPKGVSVSHRSITRLVRGTAYARFGPDEVFLLLAPSSFDAATLELWGALLNGARLVIFPQPKPALADLAASVERHGVTTLWLTAGLFHQMVEHHLVQLRHVRQLLAGGDVLAPASVRQVLETLPGCTLINGYGPTENTTFTCCYPMTDVRQIGSTVSIGRPIANTHIYILDPQLRPVPVGVPGELYIGGDGLARGYLNQPDRTAERFVPNPFAAPDNPGARLYHSGDLVRYQPDGTIEWLGRLDRQVKLQGHRIELGEIEAALQQYTSVREAVVLVREDRPGDKRLVAYVVTSRSAVRMPFQYACTAVVAGGSPVDIVTRDISSNSIGLANVPATWSAGQLISLRLRLPTFAEPPFLEGEIIWSQGGEAAVVFTSDSPSLVLLQHILASLPELPALEGEGLLHLTAKLRGFCKQVLPDYMIPAAFVMLDGLPLTIAGTVDRRVLPASDLVRRGLEQAFVLPQSAVERQIADIWCEALHIEQIGAHDNFFDLGGHSLILIQVHSRLQAICECDLTVMDLFSYPTVRALAEYMTLPRRVPPAPAPQSRPEAEHQVGRNRLKQRREQGRRI